MTHKDVFDLIAQHLENFWTAAPAFVKAVDGDKVSVQIATKTKLTNGFVLDIPVIDNVPIMQLGSSAGKIKLHIKEGDPVILIFFSSDPTDFFSKKDGNICAAKSITRNSLNYCVAIPLSRGGHEAKGVIEFYEDGTVTINNHLKVTL